MTHILMICKLLPIKNSQLGNMELLGDIIMLGEKLNHERRRCFNDIIQSAGNCPVSRQIEHENNGSTANQERVVAQMTSPV